LRFGAGGALRWWNRLLFIANLQAVSPGSPDILLIEGLQFGANAKVEYLFPLTRTVDIGVRAQSQFFFYPSFVDSNIAVSQLEQYYLLGVGFGMASLGFFLRVNF
jgi:hypothetical protein